MSHPYNQPPHRDLPGHNPYGASYSGGAPPYYQSGHEPHRGPLILVLGIIGIVMVSFLGIFAWVMGKKDLAKMDAGRMDPEGRGLTMAGMICGIVATVIFILQVFVACIYISILLAFLGLAAGAAAGASVL